MPATSQRSSRRTIRANSAGCSGTLSGRLRERPGPRQLLVNSRLRIQAAGHGQARPHRQLIRRSASLPDGIASAVEHRGSGLSDQANGISPNLRTRLPREVAQSRPFCQRRPSVVAGYAHRGRGGSGAVSSAETGATVVGDRRRSPARAASRCRPSCVGAADCAARRRPSSRIASRDRSCCRARPGWRTRPMSSRSRHSGNPGTTAPPTPRSRAPAPLRLASDADRHRSSRRPTDPGLSPAEPNGIAHQG